MPTTIANTSIEIVCKLIRDAFDKVDTDLDYIHDTSNKLIQTAKDFGLTELAEEMQNDI
jgi:hypothetical protein